MSAESARPGRELVSVVIPTRNRRALLERALASVRGQEGVSIEVIVVDEGSTDGTAGWLEALDDDRVLRLRNERATGVANARNRGIDAARGEWVAFLDDDDFWAPAKLRRQLEAGADAGFSYTGLVTTDMALRRRRTSAPPPARGLERALLGMNVIGPPSAVIARRSLLAEVGGFDPDFSILADWDLWIRCAAAAPGAPVEAPLTGYLSHPTNMHLDADAAMAEFRRLRVKHRALADALGAPVGDERWWGWIAGSLRRSGHRFRGAVLFLWLGLRLRSPRLLARAAGMLAGERLAAAARSRRPTAAAADAYEPAAASWLDAYAEPPDPAS